MPPHMAPPLGIGTGMPNYLKAKVGELVSRTLPNMNLFPSSSTVSSNTGQAFSNLTGLPSSTLCRRLSPSFTPTTLLAFPPGLSLHTLALLFTIFYRPARLIEGFGAGAYSAAVAFFF